MKKAYVSTGVVLLIIGLLLAIAWAPEWKEFLPTTEATLTTEKEDGWRVVGHMTMEEDETVVLKFKSLKPGAQILALLVSEQSYEQIMKASETQGVEAFTAMEPSDYLAKSSGEEGELRWTCTEDGSYYAIFTLLWSWDKEEADLTITQDPGYAAKAYQLREGSIFGAEFQCTETDDQLVAVLANEYAANMILKGETPPTEEILATASAGNRIQLYAVIPETGTYYLFLVPGPSSLYPPTQTTGHWPVPGTINTRIISVPEGSEMPVRFTYSIEAGKEGPWYVGVIMMIVGVAVMVLGFRKPRVQAAVPPAPTYAPPAPTVGAPTKFCTNCGAPNPADSKFCIRCGQKQE